MDDSPMMALSMITAFIPTSAFRRMRQPCSTAPWPMWPFSSTTVSVPGKPCITQVSCRLVPRSRMSRPKSPRRLAHGPT
jgi:hypothetical protein